MNENLKIKFNRTLITAEEISNEIAEENGFDKKALWFMHLRFMSRMLQYVMNGVQVKWLLGTIKHTVYKPREVAGFHGEISIIPERHKVIMEIAERFGKVYEKKGYFDYFYGDENNDLVIYITKETPKILDGEATYWGCLKVLADVLWKGETVIIVETKEELEELNSKMNEFLSEEREEGLKREIKENSDAKILRELRKELRILEVLKQNLVSSRILIINNEEKLDKIEGEV